jgi:hypothetical protein
MSALNGPASRTRSKSVPVVPIPPFIPKGESETTRLTTPIRGSNPVTLLDLSPVFEDFQNEASTSPTSSINLSTGLYDNNRVNHFQLRLHDQSLQFPLNRGFDYRNPDIIPTQYQPPMYSAKNMQSFQDYMYPTNIPLNSGFMQNPMLQPILLPEVFRLNTHYLWSVKEHSISKVHNSLLAAIAKSDLKAIKLTQYWFGISTIRLHPETVPYENRDSIHHNLLNCTNYVQFLETCSANTPPFEMQSIFPNTALYDVRVTPKQKSAIDDFTNIVCIEVIRLINNTTVCSLVLKINVISMELSIIKIYI